MTNDGNSDDGLTDQENDELTEQDQENVLQELERRRSLSGFSAIGVSFIAVLFSLYQVWLAAHGFEFAYTFPFLGEVKLIALQQLQANAIHVVLALVITFILFPPSTGEGFLSRRFKDFHKIIRARFGPDSPLVMAADVLARVLNWFMVDSDRARVTPLDVSLIIFALLGGYYYLTEFQEILSMRALGLQSGRTLGEVYPLLQAVELLPVLGEQSWAYLLGSGMILLVLEATRRALGVYLMAIVGSFIVYAKYAYLIPLRVPVISVLSTTEASWSTIVRNLWYTDQGILGVPVFVSVQFIYIFILFGSFLEMSGAGQWLIDLAYSTTGTLKGGPAKASILASGFMGTISGSSIANTVTTGTFTIPLMKKSGYRAAFSGAVEASASTGGQILPPVMGAAAFLIVEYTLTPYADVIISAAVPALVFFLGVWVMVHLEASRSGLEGVEELESVEIQAHLSAGWFYLLPIGLLLYYLMIQRLSVARSAWFTIRAILAIIAFVTAYTKKTLIPLIGTLGAMILLWGGFAWTKGGTLFRTILGSLEWLVIGASLVVLLGWFDLDTYPLRYNDSVNKKAKTVADKLNYESLSETALVQYLTFIFKSLDSGARTATSVVVAVAAAGIIPGVIATTGLGPNLTSLILNLSGGSLILLLVITAVSSIILGLGMPTTVTYILLVSLLGPAIAQFGVPVLAAHLFILYFGVIADITPPVAVAAYAASGVAKSDPFKTGVRAFSLSLNKVIVPFAFVLSPGILLLRGTGTGEEVHVLTFTDVVDLGFFLPEVLIPIIGVITGVVTLGVTVIGYLYTTVSSLERIAFGVTTFLLMTPSLILKLLPPFVESNLLLETGTRLIGGIIFLLLALSNRRTANSKQKLQGS